MPKAITPVNVTPGATGWQDVDITAHVGGDAGSVRGAILHIANQTGSGQTFGVRPKGATTTRTRTMANGWQAYQVVLVDANDVFQVNCGSTSLEVYLTGYLLDDEYDGLINEVEVTPTEDGLYHTVDISAHVGGDAPLGAILAIDNGCGTTHPDMYVRAVGSTDDYYWVARAQTNTLAVVKLDGNKQFEAKVENSCGNIYLLGWINANASFPTDLTPHAASQVDVYETIDLSAEVDADAVGVWWFSDPGDNFPSDPRVVKEAGSAYGDEWYLTIDAPAWGFTKLSAAKEIDFKTDDDSATFAVVADAVEGAATGDATATPSGVEGTGETGTVSVTTSTTAALTGLEAAGEVGTVTVSSGINVTATPSGVAAAGDAGTVSIRVDATATVTGVQGDGEIGTVTVAGAGDATVAVSGVSASGEVGSAQTVFGVTVSVSGVFATGETGTVEGPLQWEIATSPAETWVTVGEGESIWDEGASIWDEGLGVVRSIWDAGLTPETWTQAARAGQTWTVQ